VDELASSLERGDIEEAEWFAGMAGSSSARVSHRAGVRAGQAPARLRGRLLAEVVAPRGRLILCGYGSPRSGVQPYPVRAIARSYWLEPELELEVGAPEGGGSMLELRSPRRALNPS
jgi:hypothetical protein